jgi:uncharacterized membrane protein
VTDLKHSVFWLIAFHSVLAVASCWLFYLTARRGALVVSVVFIGSLLLFIHIKHIMTEQTFLFVTVLLAYGLMPSNVAVFRYAMYAIRIDIMCGYISIVATKKSAVATS